MDDREQRFNEALARKNTDEYQKTQSDVEKQHRGDWGGNTSMV